jgi:hypothetical protein
LAVVETAIVTMLGVVPVTVTGTAGALQAALAGAPVQVTVTLAEPPETRASCSE